MTPATSSSTIAAADGTVRAALADTHVRTELLDHARAFLGVWLQDRPAGVRDEAAEAAVQETASCVLEKLGEFDPAAGTAVAWLHGFLVNVLKKTARQLRRRPAQPPADGDAWDRLTTALAPTIDPDDGRMELSEILNGISAAQRTILEMRFIAELDHATIASRLGISEGNARVRLCRALSAAKAVAGVAAGEDAP